MATLFDDASLVMIPSGYKDDKLYSIKPTSGDGDFTFSRDGSGASPATRVNSAGLIEKGRTNLLTYSNDFSNADWVKLGNGTGSTAVVTSGFSDPDGGSNAWRLQCDLNGGTTSSDQSLIYQLGSVTGVFAFSYYVKSNTGADQDFAFGNGLAGGNFTTATATTSWQRFDTFFNCTVNNTSFIGARGTMGTDDTLDILIYAAQLEKGLVATSYIETTTAAASAGILGDMPRLDYSGGASCPSLLLEPSRTNLIEQSEYFGSWLTLNASATDNAATSPEGVINAAALVDDATNGAHYLQSAVVTHATGEDMMASVFLKKGTRSQARVRLSGGASDAYFNLDDGSVISENGCTATVEDYGNGWYRCAIFDTSAAFGSGRLQVMSAVNGNSTYVGDGTEAIYIYGAQYEHNASYPTSYVPTYGSATARAKDHFLMLLETAGITSSGQTEATLFIEFEKPNNGENVDLMRFRGTGTLGRGYIYNYGVGFASDWGQALNFTIGENTKVVWRVNSLTDGEFFLNGTKSPNASGTAWSGFWTIRFNEEGAGGVLKIKQIALFNSALTDAECTALTT